MKLFRCEMKFFASLDLAKYVFNPKYVIYDRGRKPEI